MDRRGIVQSKGQVVRMLIGSVCDYSMSGVQKSSQASSAAADDVRRQLEKELNDTADRLRRIDRVSPADAEFSRGRQSGCDVLDEAEAIATTAEQSRRAEFATRVDTRGGPPARRQLRANQLSADKPGRLATRTRRRAAEGPAAETQASGSERRAGFV